MYIYYKKKLTFALIKIYIHIYLVYNRIFLKILIIKINNLHAMWNKINLYKKISHKYFRHFVKINKTL